MDCCILVIVLIIIVVLLAFGMMILGFVVTILNVVYLLLLDITNWIRRIFWSKTLVDLSYEDLNKMFDESETRLRHLNSEDENMLQGVGVKGREIEDFIDSFKVDANNAKINDTKAKITILKKLIQKQQHSENVRLSEQHAERQEELQRLALTSEHKLIEQFVNKNLDNDMRNDLPKLQALLKSKGWNVTADELQNLVDNENKKQHLDGAKLKILASNPENQKEILKSYLNYYQSFDIELIALEQILEERDLSYDDTASLQSQLRKVKSEVETEQFEKSLMNESQ